MDHSFRDVIYGRKFVMDISEWRRQLETPELNLESIL